MKIKIKKTIVKDSVKEQLPLKTYKIKNHVSGITHTVKAVSYKDAKQKYDKHVKRDSITEDADKVMGTYKGYTIKQNVDGNIYVLKKSGEKEFFESWKKAYEAIKTGTINDSITEDADIAQLDIKETFLPEEATADNIKYVGFNELRKISFYSFGDRYFAHHDLEGRTEELDKAKVQQILKKNLLGETTEEDVTGQADKEDEVVSEEKELEDSMQKQGKTLEILNQKRVGGKEIILAKWGNEYVVGWNWDAINKVWQQGHYTKDLKEAFKKYDGYKQDSKEGDE